MIRFLRLLLVALAIALTPAAASAQDSALANAKAQGLVGERPDGLVGAVVSRADVAQLVERVNGQRMALYADVARRNNTSVQATQRIFGERLVRETPPGQYYMDAGGRWQRR